jgi:dephospho-CoA kinase
VTGTRVIGLTGGIASGKSTVTRILESLGAVIIDADMLSREVVEPDEPAWGAIVAEFGAGVVNPDRTINRQELGRLVFADPEARMKLEKITHPAIARRAEEKLAACRTKSVPVVFYVAPLLIEAGRTALADEIWVVYADEATQLERLITRDGITADDARSRLAAQMPMDKKKQYGRVVIDNRGTERELEQKVREVWEKEIRVKDDM